MRGINHMTTIWTLVVVELRLVRLIQRANVVAIELWEVASLLFSVVALVLVAAFLVAVLFHLQY